MLKYLRKSKRIEKKCDISKKLFLDCFCVIITFFGKRRDFINLCLCVKNLYNHVVNIYPKCCSNILFVYIPKVDNGEVDSLPTNYLQIVRKMKCMNRLQPNRMMEVLFTSFPYLTKLFFEQITKYDGEKILVQSDSELINQIQLRFFEKSSSSIELSVDSLEVFSLKYVNHAGFGYRRNPQTEREVGDCRFTNTMNNIKKLVLVKAFMNDWDILKNLKILKISDVRFRPRNSFIRHNMFERGKILVLEQLEQLSITLKTTNIVDFWRNVTAVRFKIPKLQRIKLESVESSFFQTFLERFDRPFKLLRTYDVQLKYYNTTENTGIHVFKTFRNDLFLMEKCIEVIHFTINCIHVYPTEILKFGLVIVNKPFLNDINISFGVLGKDYASEVSLQISDCPKLNKLKTHSIDIISLTECPNLRFLSVSNSRKRFDFKCRYDNSSESCNIPINLEVLKLRDLHLGEFIKTLIHHNNLHHDEEGNVFSCFPKLKRIRMGHPDFSLDRKGKFRYIVRNVKKKKEKGENKEGKIISCTVCFTGFKFLESLLIFPDCFQSIGIRCKRVSNNPNLKTMVIRFPLLENQSLEISDLGRLESLRLVGTGEGALILKYLPKLKSIRKNTKYKICRMKDLEQKTYRFGRKSRGGVDYVVIGLKIPLDIPAIRLSRFLDDLRSDTVLYVRMMEKDEKKRRGY